MAKLSSQRASYCVQVEQRSGKWITIMTGSRDYCLGFFRGRLGFSPRLAQRVLRLISEKPSKVIIESASSGEVHIGQIAGFPSAEQYEAAAAKALAAAQDIRSRTSSHPS